MVRELLVAGLLVLCGCTQSRTGVVITVQGGARSIDQLRVTATLDSLAPQTLDVPSVAHALSLPTTFFAELPDHDETVSFAVAAFENGVEVAQGSVGPLTVKSHEAGHATIVLGTAGDGGTDGASIACGGVSTLCKTGDLFCDGFETTSASDPFPDWSSTKAGGYQVDAFSSPGTLIEDSTARSCNGGHAMHAVTMGPSQQAFAGKNGLSFPSTLYLRALVYVPSTPGLTGTTVFLGVGNGSNYLQFGWSAEDESFIFRPNFGGASGSYKTTLPLDRWFCLTSQIVLSTTNGQVGLSLDGQTLGSANGVVTLPASGAFDTFTAGIIGAETTSEMYFDDVAISGSPLACP